MTVIVTAAIAVAAAALSTPASARPTTPCDERPQGCTGLRDEGGGGEDPAARPDREVQHKKRHVPNDDIDGDDGGQDSGGW